MSDGGWLPVNSKSRGLATGVVESELTAVSSVETELNQDRRLEFPTSYRRLEFGDLCLSDFEDILSKSGRRSFAHCLKSAPSATMAAIIPTLHTATSQRRFDFVFCDDFGVDTGLLSAVMYLPLTPMSREEIKQFLKGHFRVPFSLFQALGSWGRGKRSEKKNEGRLRRGVA